MTSSTKIPEEEVSLDTYTTLYGQELVTPEQPVFCCSQKLLLQGTAWLVTDALGLYKLTWKSCCMILLVNFNQEEEIKCSQKEREKTFNYTFKYKGVETKFY